MIDDLEDFVKKSAFPKYGKDIILNDLIKMRFILQNIEKFGEQDYWEKFERVTGLFGSLYHTLSDKEKTEAQTILQKLIYRINQVIETSSNLTTIAQAAWPLLT